MTVIAGFEFEDGVNPALVGPLTLIFAAVKEHGAVVVDLDDSPESSNIRHFFQSDGFRDYFVAVPTHEVEDFGDAHEVIITLAEPPYINWKTGL